MEQRISYATTSDGMRIAYAVAGSGPPLVSCPSPPDNHLQLEWDDPPRRRSVETLARHRTVVRFDGRGSGLSDRELSDFSLEARMSDLEAVVDRLGLATFDLLSGGHGNQLTVAFAATHPERVDHLIAVNPFVRGEQFMSPQQLHVWETLLENNFRMFTDALGGEIYGYGKEEGPRFGEFFRAAVEPDTAARVYREMIKVDLTSYLARLQCPVLIVQADDWSLSAPTAAREVAAAIRQSSFVVVNERQGAEPTGELGRRIGEFLGEEWAYEAPAEQRTPTSGGLQTVLFTDLEQHSQMMQQLGDEAGRAVLREHERLTREALRAHGGAEVKSMGDGFMASFRSAQRALECAAELQRQIREADSRLAYPLRVRVGINAGEPIDEDGDLFGASVIAAARIAQLAAGGETLVANVVRELVAGKGFLFADRGMHPLRGFDEPVHVWELR